MNPDISDGDLLWAPSPEQVAQANLTAFSGWLGRERGLHFDGYQALWRWSVTDLEGFWQAVWDYFGIASSAPPARVLGSRAMPGAQWFPGARLNYAEHVLRSERPGTDALLYRSETTPLAGLPWEEFAGQVRILATRLRSTGGAPRRPGRLDHAEHPAHGRRDAGDHQHRRDLGELLPRFRLARRDRPVRAARRRRCCSAWTATATAGRSSIAPQEMRQIAGALDSLEHVVTLPYLDPERAEPFVPGALRLGRGTRPSAGPGGRVRLRAGPVRASVVDPVLLRYHRPAQADHARPRRHPAGAAQAADVPHGHAARATACSSSPPRAG